MKIVALVLVSIFLVPTAEADVACNFSQDSNQYDLWPRLKDKDVPIEAGSRFTDSLPSATDDGLRVRSKVDFEVLQIKALGVERAKCAFGYSRIVTHKAALLQLSPLKTQTWAICTETTLEECR